MIIYVHTGTIFPDHLIDSIFQTLFIISKSSPTSFEKIVVILSDDLISSFNEKISQLYLDTSIIRVVKESLLRNTSLEKYLKIFNNSFRDNFWIHTTTRFFYITEYLKKYSKESTNFIHLESDVMLYDLSFFHSLKKLDPEEIYMVKDCESRVVPSILIYADIESSVKLNEHILSFLKEVGSFQNDMVVLSKYPKLKELPYSVGENNEYVFDGAAIGQFLCGIDPRNYNFDQVPESVKSKALIFKSYAPDLGFINESCPIMASSSVVCSNEGYFLKDSKDRKDSKDSKIVNLHIHSKKLWQVSSITDIMYKDIITGDKFVENCDILFTTQETVLYHKELMLKPTCSIISFTVPGKFNDSIKKQL